ncbi:hypothetical protein NMY22_g13793 [Coprinellus aureogranulatus]|nr:hypothetical protein NMY22_g13793 [Coprinellus aureogranulatus]
MQDRHVVINIVTEGSDELRVYEFLRKQTLETLRDVCLLPVLDILALGRTPTEFRWGEYPMQPQAERLGEVTEILLSMLKALSILHSHNTVHRDICDRNVLVNHYGPGLGFDSVRARLRSGGQLYYALMDFDIAIVFPPEAKRSACRLPSEMSYHGSYPQPDDASQGEPDYDPFAFDVACLGLLFCSILYPLLDGMTTEAVSRRFTALEALQFLERHIKNTPAEILAMEYRGPAQKMTHFDERDRWKGWPRD